MGSFHANAIHPTAIIASGAVLGEGTTVGPYSIIGPHVKLGRNTTVGPHVVIEGHTHLGEGNRIFQFASVGAEPQDLKFKGEASELRVGNNNIIREFVTLQPGTSGGGMVTKIGDGNLFMANSHVGHDTIIGDRCIFANSAALSGHVLVGNRVVVGGLSGIHQFVCLGDMSMIGAGAMVAQDIPPFCMAQGDRAKLVGLNRVGLERGGATREEASLLKRTYRLVLFGDAPEVKGRTLRERIAHARTLAAGSSLTESFLNFLESSSRGVARVRSLRADNEDDGE
jgi:UDP-N-acetylglucosamine acyltransferase